MKKKKEENAHVIDTIGTRRQVVGDFAVSHLAFVPNLSLDIDGRWQGDL